MLFCAFVLPFGDFSNKNKNIYSHMQTASSVSPFAKFSPN